MNKQPAVVESRPPTKASVFLSKGAFQSAPRPFPPGASSRSSVAEQPFGPRSALRVVVHNDKYNIRILDKRKGRCANVIDLLLFYGKSERQFGSLPACFPSHQNFVPHGGHERGGRLRAGSKPPADRLRKREVEASPGIEPGCKDLQSSA